MLEPHSGHCESTKYIVTMAVPLPMINSYWFGVGTDVIGSLRVILALREPSLNGFTVSGAVVATTTLETNDREVNNCHGG